MLLTAVAGCLAPLVGVCDPTAPAIAPQAPADSSFDGQGLVGLCDGHLEEGGSLRRCACEKPCRTGEDQGCVKRVLINAVRRKRFTVDRSEWS